PPSVGCELQVLFIVKYIALPFVNRPAADPGGRIVIRSLHATHNERFTITRCAAWVRALTDQSCRAPPTGMPARYHRRYANCNCYHEPRYQGDDQEYEADFRPQKPKGDTAVD